MPTTCACGLPLHYTNPKNEAYMIALVATQGETIAVAVDRRLWKVPRHYIALHGLIAAELPKLAEKYGFKEVIR
jgi:hypothetical protein